ncbi:hypothetical protein Esti_003037 [Eimeria stiedai]
MSTSPGESASSPLRRSRVHHLRLARCMQDIDFSFAFVVVVRSLGFANLILLLDLPQLPAIFAANVSKGFKKFCRELSNVASQDVQYPNNRLNPQDARTNRMGRPRAYNHEEKTILSVLEEEAGSSAPVSMRPADATGR